MTLLGAASAFGVSREILRRAIAEAVLRGNFAKSVDGKQSIREFHVALSGDGRTARARLTLARAEMAEYDLKVASGEFMPREECSRFIVDTFAPIRQMIVSLPGRLTHLLVQQDAASIRAHLDRYRDEFLKAAKENVPQKDKDSNENTTSNS